DAVDALLSGKELNLILFGRTDLLLIDSGKISMREAITVKLRYAADYGQPYYPLDTYFSKTTTEQSKASVNNWIVLVESEQDVRIIETLFERFNFETQLKVVPAGGQLAMSSLAEYLTKYSSMNVAAILTPMHGPDIQDEQEKQLRQIGIDLVVLRHNLEGWLESYVSAQEYNTLIMLTNRNGKMARRFARFANLEKLLDNTPAFNQLICKLGATIHRQ
ncbi:hypothetical protein, partial [Vibrio parahaemolyticus]